jgi:hypothetical protein
MTKILNLYSSLITKEDVLQLNMRDLHFWVHTQSKESSVQMSQTLLCGNSSGKTSLYHSIQATSFFVKLFVDEVNVGCAKIKSWKNKNIDGFYT